jgi:hypothetical protein
MARQTFYCHFNQSKTCRANTIANCSSHMFHTVPDDVEMIAENVDEFGDSYCRDVSVEGLRKVD